MAVVGTGEQSQGQASKGKAARSWTISGATDLYKLDRVGGKLAEEERVERSQL